MSCDMLVAQGLELHIIWHQKSCEDMVMVPRSGVPPAKCLEGGYKLMFEKHVGLNRCLFFQKFVGSLSYYVCICHVCSMLFFVISDVLQGNLWQ